MASVLGFLLLPPAMQVCGKRVFGVTERIDDVRRRGGILQADSVCNLILFTGGTHSFFDFLASYPFCR